MLVKVFGEANALDLETAIQDWLDDNPAITIVDRSIAAAGVSTYCYVIIWYNT